VNQTVFLTVIVLVAIILAGILFAFPWLAWPGAYCISADDARLALINHLGGSNAFDQEHGALVREIPFNVGACALGGRIVTSYEGVWFVSNDGKVTR